MIGGSFFVFLAKTFRLSAQERHTGMKSEPRTWLTADEAAKHLKVSKAAIRKWTRFGKIPHHIIGPGNRTVRYELTELDEWALGKKN